MMLLLALFLFALPIDAMQPGTSSSATTAVTDMQLVEKLLDLNKILDHLQVEKRLETLRRILASPHTNPHAEQHKNTRNTSATALSYLTSNALVSVGTYLIAQPDSAPTRIITEGLPNLSPTLVAVILSGCSLLGSILVASLCSRHRSRAYTDERLRAHQQEMDAHLETTKKDITALLEQKYALLSRQIKAQSEADRAAQEAARRGEIEHLLSLSNQRLEEKVNELERHLAEAEQNLKEATQQQQAHVNRAQEEIKLAHQELTALKDFFGSLKQSNDLLLHRFVPDVLANIDRIAEQCARIIRDYQIQLEKRDKVSCFSKSKP